jgi:nitric oxide dioxygenase
MSLTVRQISLVRSSFAEVAPIADLAAGLFYDRLFAVLPEVRRLFPADLGPQRTKLMQALALAVASLDRPEAILPVLRELGRRHAGYGVVDAHYAAVGESLLWTLRQGLGDGFTPEVEAAWAETYALVATTMIEGSRRPRDATAAAAAT